MTGALFTACSPAPQHVAEPVAPANPAQRLAETTTFLVNSAAFSYDSATVQAAFTLIDSPLPKVREYATSAKDAAKRASQSLDDAIAAGERLRIHVEPPGSLGTQRRFSHYWYLGKAKLDVARLESDRAQVAADSVLACAASSCVASPARSLRTHSQAAAGATREAESLVRIAMIYVK